MEKIVNTFKRGLGGEGVQYGLWAALADSYVTEVLATAGFDWLLVDCEHAPNDIRSTLSQLQTLAAYKSHAIVRPVEATKANIKQLLDLGAQTLLLPMIDTVEQARDAVAATRYPPFGMRGVGSALARASRWNRIPGYLGTSSEDICVIVQAESKASLENLEAIAQVEGVDAVFFGPADLSASLGFLGKPGAPEVRSAICDGIHKVRAAGKGAGVLAPDREFAEEYIKAGANFVAVGTDTGLLSVAVKNLADGWIGAKAPAVLAERGGY
jgi:4-hydroxy-2-oxoheptanedioate aldolase